MTHKIEVKMAQLNELIRELDPLVKKFSLFLKGFTSVDYETFKINLLKCIQPDFTLEKKKSTPYKKNAAGNYVLKTFSEYLIDKGEEPIWACISLGEMIERIDEKNVKEGTLDEAITMITSYRDQIFTLLKEHGNQVFNQRKSDDFTQENSVNDSPRFFSQSNTCSQPNVLSFEFTHENSINDSPRFFSQYSTYPQLNTLSLLEMPSSPDTVRKLYFSIEEEGMMTFREVFPGSNTKVDENEDIQPQQPSQRQQP